MDKFDWEKEGCVSIWVGDFADAEEFDNYMEESIGEDDSIATPLNEFAEDIGFGFYDHDFQEAEFFEDKKSIRELLLPFSDSESYCEEAVIAANRKNISQANAAILLFDCDYKPKTSEKSKVKFLGSFSHQS
jgi:hypothetical protein